jgi:hypothetical protein
MFEPQRLAGVVSLGGLVARCCMGWHERFVIQLITTESFRPSGASDLASLSRATALLNLAPMSAADLQGRAVSDRLLDLHLHQLASHLAIRSRVGRPVKERGLVVIRVHTPEFSFDETVENVRQAVNGTGVEYPIANDDNRAICRGFGNHYWPALYVLDAGGMCGIITGEGNHEQLERTMAICWRTREAQMSSGVETTHAVDLDAPPISRPS